MCSHYLVEPVACTPGAGWEKGQVENQVGTVRKRFFTPRLHFATLEEMNQWLEACCVDYAKTMAHPEFKERKVWDVFMEEKASLVPWVGPFDGFHETTVAASKTCLVRFDRNRYSVMAKAATLQQADGKAVKKVPAKPMTAIGSPKLYLFTPELIHAPERIGILKFKLVPQGERG